MTEKELQDLITRPSDRLVADLKKIDGDITILGAAGKMGPSLCLLLKRALTENNIPKRIFAVSRFSDSQIREQLENAGVETHSGDLLDDTFLNGLPKAKNVLYLVGHKFGTGKNQALTWAMNAYLPGRVATHFSHSRIVAFSSGNIYPFTPVESRGASEQTIPNPIGEYAQSCLGRERLFEYFSQKNNTPVLIYRLNYALDLRYGVLNDIAQLVKKGEPIDISMGYVNIIWQGDANEYAIRCLLHATAPASPLNITGPEKLPVAEIAARFGELFDKKPILIGNPNETALLSDAQRAHDLFGLPSVSAEELINWTADWIKNDGPLINKPTHFQERKGNF